MMRLCLIMLLLAPMSARAADYAVVLNDAERAALLEALDEATKAKGLAIAPNTVFLANKIRSAPTVTEQKPATPDKDKESSK